MASDLEKFERLVDAADALNDALSSEEALTPEEAHRVLEVLRAHHRASSALFDAVIGPDVGPELLHPALRLFRRHCLLALRMRDEPIPAMQFLLVDLKAFLRYLARILEVQVSPAIAQGAKAHPPGMLLVLKALEGALRLGRAGPLIAPGARRPHYRQVEKLLAEAKVREIIHWRNQLAHEVPAFKELMSLDPETTLEGHQRRLQGILSRLLPLYSHLEVDWLIYAHDPDSKELRRFHFARDQYDVFRWL